MNWIEEYQFDDNQCRAWKGGGKTVWIRRTEDEWLVASKDTLKKQPGISCSENAKVPSDLEWKRVISSKLNSLKVRPATPDLPLALKPVEVMSILPGEQCHFYIKVPLWLQFIIFERKKEELLFEVPMTALSRTWFGDSSSGFISYSLCTKLLKEAGKNGYESLSIFCPFYIYNNHKIKLDLIKFCIHGENLSIFEDTGRLVSNTVVVFFRGDEQEDRISISETPPEQFQGATRVAQPRKPLNRSILRKSFRVIKQFTSIG